MRPCLYLTRDLYPEAMYADGSTEDVKVWIDLPEKAGPDHFVMKDDVDAPLVFWTSSVPINDEPFTVTPEDFTCALDDLRDPVRGQNNRIPFPIRLGIGHVCGDIVDATEIEMPGSLAGRRPRRKDARSDELARIDHFLHREWIAAHIPHRGEAA